MRQWLGFGLVVLLATGCSTSFGGGYSGNDFGATPGGVQDLTFARDLVDEGQVPPAESVLVEAMFSEHDMPLAGPPCEKTLCVRGAVGAAPGREGKPAAWAQVGLSSSIDPSTFKRPPLSVIATVDVSGSMGWEYGGEDGGVSPGQLARTLLLNLADSLNADDRIAMVAYGSGVSTPLGWTAGGSPAVTQAIAALHTDGSTNMEAGLQAAFQLGQGALAEGRDVRVMLFTDEQPNVGATSSTDFEDMVSDAADQEIGLTVFGLGLGLGAELMKSMSHLRGGNAFSMTKMSEIDTFMDDNWPWFTVPVAYDMHVNAVPSEGLLLAAGYGFPETSQGKPAELDVASVFLSKRRGALVLELAPSGDAVIEGDGVDLTLTYTDPSGEAQLETLSPKFDGSPLDERGVSMPQEGIARAVSLAVFTSELRESLEQYSLDKATAIATLSAALDRLNKDALAAGDAELAAEVEFWKKLQTLMEQGAPQGDMYGGEEI